MAREIHEREDLLRDARALAPRVMLRVAIGDREQDVFAGFRGQSLSLYFGGDPVYHFNACGELRRAFVNDRLIKAEQGRLVFMTRRRRAAETSLQRQPLDDAADQALLMQMYRDLDQLRTAIAGEKAELLGERPSSGEALPRLIAWLDANRGPAIAASLRVT